MKEMPIRDAFRMQVDELDSSWEDVRAMMLNLNMPSRDNSPFREVEHRWMEAVENLWRLKKIWHKLSKEQS